MKNTISHAVSVWLLTLLVAGGGSATRVDATEAGVMSISSPEVSSTGKRDYVSWVDPRIESARGRWFFSTPAARPFGMAKLTPHTVNRGQGGGGYNCTVHTALGFCHLHGWMTTGLEVMPTTGGDFSVTDGEAGWKSAFDPKTEIVKPGYHKLFLEKYATWVELTTTQRVGLHRYTYTKDGQADIVINLGGPAGPMKMKNGRITKVSDTQLEGYYDRTNGTWGGPAAVRIFFVIQFEKAFSNFTTYDDPQHNSTSAYVTYDNLSAGDVVQMKAGLSFTSIAGARANLAAELDHWDFDAVRDESFRIWNFWLGKIDVEGGTDAGRTKFYTDLWHVLLGRHVLNDVDGAYPDYTNGKGGNGSLKVKQLPLGRAVKEDLAVAKLAKSPVAKLAKSFGGQPKVLATSATEDMSSSAARLNHEGTAPVAGACTVRWKLLEGNGQVEFSEPDKLETWVSFDRPGTYTLQATVNGRGRMGLSGDEICLRSSERAQGFISPGFGTANRAFVSKHGLANTVVEVLGSTDEEGKTFGDWIADYVSIDADGRGPAHDPDGDGVANLVERFFGGNPARADAEVAPRHVVGRSPDRPTKSTVGLKRFVDGRPAVGNVAGSGDPPTTAPRLLGEEKGRRIQFRQSKKLSAGDFYVLQYREAAGQGDWRLLPGVTFHQTKELADSIQMEAKLPQGLDSIHPVEVRFCFIEQPVNHALRARVSVSSAFNRDYAGALAVDGIKGIHMANEWSSAGEATPRIQLDWPTAVTIRGVCLFDRPNPDDHTQSGTLSFSDGTSIDVADIADDGSMKTIVFNAKTVMWVRFQVTGGRGSNRGLSEIQALSDIAPTTHTFGLR